jgi:hypothetical protein
MNIPLTLGPGNPAWPSPMGPNGRGGVAPNGGPGCWDWSGYCLDKNVAEFFDLEFDFFAANTAAMANGATRQVTQQIGPEGVFVAVAYTGLSSVAPAGADFSTLISDLGSQRDLSNDFVLAGNNMGAYDATFLGPRPFFLPRMFSKQGMIRIQARNDSGGNITALRVCLLGFKVYDLAALNATAPKCVVG